MHLRFNLTDPRWAIVMAGAINSARTGAHKDMNRPFTVSFAPNSKLLEHIGSAFERDQGEDYLLPTEAQYPFIDLFQATNFAKTLAEQHGIQQEPMVVPLYLQSLATNALLLTHSIVAKPSYFLPHFNRNELANAPVSDAIIETKDHHRLAVAFCKGLKIENPVIICAEDYDDYELALAYFNTKLIVTKPDHLLQYIARSQYNGYDRMAENIPVVSIIDDTIKPDNRFLVSWSGQIPIFAQEADEQITGKATAYNIRRGYNFDHRRWYKDQAEKAKCEA